jgi:hypothetical protein
MKAGRFPYSRSLDTPRHIGKLWHFAKTLEAAVRKGLHKSNENNLARIKSVRIGLHILKKQQ